MKKLNIFDILNHINYQNFDFYKNLNEQEKKQAAPFVLMRWLSCCKDIQEHIYYLLCVNEFVNKNLWDITKHPELQNRTLFACGIGKKSYHKWIKNNSKSNSNKIFNFFKQIFPNINQQEFNIIKKQFDINSFRQLIRSKGVNEKIEKELITQWKKIN